MLRADPQGLDTAGRPAELWRDYVVAGLALLVLLSGYGTVVEGDKWWATPIFVSVVTAAACVVPRGVGLRFVAPFALVVESLVLAWIFVPETFSRLLPTGKTFTAIGDLATAAQTMISQEQAPVPAAQPIVLVLSVSFGLLVIVTDFLLQRRSAAPLFGIVLVAVYVTPALIVGETPSVWLFIAAAGLWLVLLRSKTPTSLSASRRSKPALVLGSVAVLLGALFPWVSPDISAVAISWGKPESSVFARGVNPMLELGQNLRRNGTSTALTYTTTLDTPPYLKVATLRDFTGATWKPASARVTDAAEGETAIYRSIETELATTTITIKELRSTSLPVPYPGVPDVTGLDGEYQWRKVGLALQLKDGDSKGQTYTVQSLDRRPTATQMRELSTPVGPSLESYIALPDQMPAMIGAIAREVTAGATNDYDKALALQKYFRTAGGFEYSETAPVAEGYDGNGVDVIAEFLEVKAGYCVHFSSSMAVMARSLGIPARIAVGYAPGRATTVKNGVTEYEVTSDDLHAWPELYFRGVGWIEFEPTTSVGSPTSFAEPASALPDADPDAPSAPDSAAEPEADIIGQDVSSPSESTARAAPTRSVAVALVGLMIVLAAPGLIRILRRQLRLRKGRVGVDALWRELQDTGIDYRMELSAADTPRAIAARFSMRNGIDADALGSLLRRVERSRFARDFETSDQQVDELRSVLASVRRGAAWPERLRAAVLPQSLVRRPAAASSLG